MPGVDNDGRSTTLTALLDKTLAGGARYDVVVLLAGINDLGRGNKTAGAVFDNLMAMVDKAAGAARHAVVVVEPWANRFVSRDSDNEAQRQRLNRALAAALDGGADASPRVLLDDVEARDFRFWELPAPQRDRLQDDALHLTAEGYDRLGASIAATLSRAGVLRDIACSANRPPKARPSRPRPAELSAAAPAPATTGGATSSAAGRSAASAAARGGMVAAVTAGLMRGWGR